MISVIIPTYNREQTIERAMQSVLDQTHRDLELIVVDDCSTDGTADVVRAISDSRVRYIRHTSNQGACAARNTGIDAAQGEYIAFQDSDDKWLPDKLEKQLQKIKKSGADLVFCKYYRKSAGGNSIVGPIQYHEGFLRPVINVYGIGTQTLFAKSEVFKEIRFDIEMPRFQELELLLRISIQYSIYCMEDVLVEYNYMSDSISLNPQRLVFACTRMLEKNPNLIKDYPDLGKSISSALVLGAKETRGDKKIRKTLFEMARQFDPSFICRLKILRRILLIKLPQGARGR